MSNEFLTDLFGDQEGIVYAPVKGEKFKQYFFEWPQERDKLERHLNDFDKRDVYISPVLFSERKISPESFKGTSYLWTEFDGSTPIDAIEPTMRIMSSQQGHEHWYWKLDHFETSKAIVEDYTRRIAYHYGADLSVWDYQNVLRPPDTWNYKRNKPVSLLTKSDKIYTLDDFGRIPIPPAGSNVSISLGRLPSREEILVKYRFSSDAQDLLFKKVEHGKRSDALVRLGYECIEAGLSNEETFVILEERDSVWGKFVGRTDRQKRLEEIIASVRRRKATTSEIVQDTPEVYRFYDFMRTKIKLEWAIEGLLPVAGSMVIFGKPGIGKSTFSLRLAIDLALGRENFLIWPIIRPQKLMFISLEMQHYEVKEFFDNMELPLDEQIKLQDQLFIWPIGHAYPFDTPDQQIELIKHIKLFEPDVIIIDSLGLSMYGSVKDDDAVKRLNSFLNEDIRKAHKCSYIFVHHPRKQGLDTANKDIEQDDLFGSQYITANAQTVVVLSQRKGSHRLKVRFLKRRLSFGPEEFDIERTPNRGFQLVGSNSTASVSTTPPVNGETSSSKKPDDGALGKLFDL